MSNVTELEVVTEEASPTERGGAPPPQRAEPARRLATRSDLGDVPDSAME